MDEELKRYIDGMDKAFEENDEQSWDFYHEVIGEFAKNEYNRGALAFKQMTANGKGMVLQVDAIVTLL